MSMDLARLAYPWRRIAALAVGCFAGVSVSALSLLTVLLGQRALWPSAELRISALTAAPGSAPWVEQWTLVAFCVALGFASLFAGYMVGSEIYEWLLRRYGLRKRKKEAPAG